jgi:Valyl-tRNA synthetase
MYYIKYQVIDSDETFIVATTRPETMFGDVCIVVNPKDEKVKHLIGKKCINPANNQELEIIGDDYIEIGFGTGIMKCTPAHDPNDYQIALRHNLKMPICMNDNGTMNKLCGKYEGLDRFKCREELLKEFKEKMF